jgi:hypothetical protein
MTAAQLQDVMAENGCMPRNRLVADAEYSLCTQNWFESAFASALRTLLFQLNQTLWRDQSNDCDDFARLGASFAQMLHNRTGQKPGTGLAIGEFWFQSARGPHAILSAVIYVGTEYKLIFLEPQNQKPVNLTYEEVASCFAYRF